MIFTLPIMFLACFEYQLHSNEEFKGWTFEQPTILIIKADTHDVNISNVYWLNNDQLFCQAWKQEITSFDTIKQKLNKKN